MWTTKILEEKPKSQVRQVYRAAFADCTLACDCAIPELSPPEPGGKAPELRVCHVDRLPEAGSGPMAQPWPGTEGRIVQRSTPQGIEVRARRVAEFLIQPASATVQCCPEPGASPAAVRHFLLNQILPRMLAIRRPLVLHASAVRIGRYALVFAGRSGSGKSSLAASLVAHRGAGLISDDAVIVYPGTPCLIVGTYARSRLWSDAQRGLGLTGDGAPPTPERSKSLLEPTGPRSAPGTRLPAAGIVLIDVEPTGGAGIRIHPLKGAKAVMALIERSLGLFDTAPSTLARQLEAAASVTASGLPILGLSFPRRFDLLGSVHKALIDALGDRISAS